MRSGETKFVAHPERPLAGSGGEESLDNSARCCYQMKIAVDGVKRAKPIVGRRDKRNFVSTDFDRCLDGVVVREMTQCFGPLTLKICPEQ